MKDPRLKTKEYEEEVLQLAHERTRVMLPIISVMYLGYTLYDWTRLPNLASEFMVIRLGMFLLGLMASFAVRLKSMRSHVLSIVYATLFIFSFSFSWMVYIGRNQCDEFYLGVIFINISYCVINSFKLSRFVIFTVVTFTAYLVAVFTAAGPIEYDNLHEALWCVPGTAFLLSILIALFLTQFQKQYLLSSDLSEKDKQLQKAYQMVKNQADRDPLTFLYNRRTFLKIMDRMITKSRDQKLKFSLVFFDVDNFKTINDNYGHIVGDLVLCRIAETLSNNLRAGTYVARYGGDEFLMMIDGSTKEELMERIRSIQGAIHAMKFQTNDGNFSITSTFGAAEFDPLLDEDATGMINRADRVMLEVKKTHKGGIQIV